MNPQTNVPKPFEKPFHAESIDIKALDPVIVITVPDGESIEFEESVNPNTIREIYRGLAEGGIEPMPEGMPMDAPLDMKLRPWTLCG